MSGLGFRWFDRWVRWPPGVLRRVFFLGNPAIFTCRWRPWQTLAAGRPWFSRGDRYRSATLTVVGPLSAGSRGNNAAFVGNVGLGGTYRMSCNLSLNAGYQVFWVDGVALATNQFDNVDLNNYSAYGANRDSLYFHGGYAGLTFAF